MKKLIAFVAIVGLAFSACNGKYTIAKRKYNKGFYVSKSGGNSTKPTESLKPVRTLETAEKIETVVVAKTPAVEQQPNIAPVKSFANGSAQNKTSKHIANTGNNAVASTNHTQDSQLQIKPLNIEANKANSAKKGGDGNLVLMIILALFPILCLIAVYMHDGKVTVNFWVDLLLHLTFIGEIIYALLVVLDVVDLS